MQSEKDQSVDQRMDEHKDKNMWQQIKNEPSK